MRQVRYMEMGALPGWVGLAVRHDAFLRELRRLGVKDAPDFVSSGKDGTCHFFTHPRNGEMRLVCINKKAARSRKKSEIIGLLAHEGMHVWQDIKRDMGEKEPSQEMEAYAVQHIVQCLHKMYEEMPA